MGNDTATSCLLYYDTFSDPSSWAPVISLFAILYAMIFLLGSVGNSCVIFMTVRHRRLQTVQNLFILNLAMSDLVMCCFSLPITPITNVYKNWYFGEQMCHLLPWIQGISVFIGTFSLCIIAVDRYFLIRRPHRMVITLRKAKVITAVLWLAAAFFTLPYSVYMELTSVAGLCGEFCTETWPHTGLSQAYTAFVLVAQFVVPFAVMFYCYWHIFRHLRERAKAKISRLAERNAVMGGGVVVNLPSMPVSSVATRKELEMQVSPVQSYRDSVRHECYSRADLASASRRNTLVLAAMMTVFGVAWLPHNVVSVFMEFFDIQTLETPSGGNYIYLVNLVTHSVAMTNIAANPFLYGLLNPDFVVLLKKSALQWTHSVRRLLRLRSKPSAPDSNSIRKKRPPPHHLLQSAVLTTSNNLPLLNNPSPSDPPPLLLHNNPSHDSPSHSNAPGPLQSLL